MLTDPSPAEEELGRGAQARLALIRAAAEVFGESGVDGATTREIARRAQQNIAAIAYYFGGKEGLYLAVAEHIVELVVARIGPLLDEIEAFLASERRAPNRCLDYTVRLLAETIGVQEAMVPVTSVIVREQTHPTRAFDIVYEGCLERVQRCGAALLQAYLGPTAERQECALRFHALLGQALAFRFARETILRRTGWRRIGPDKEAAIRAVITEHTELTLQALRRKARQKEET
jgi:TetR/AcrR family transcriptional regulator, regulator of cefoperazone and chloramphenicol sensitivity